MLYKVSADVDVELTTTTTTCYCAEFSGLFKEHYAVHEIFNTNRSTHFGLDILTADTLKQTTNLLEHIKWQNAL